MKSLAWFGLGVLVGAAVAVGLVVLAALDETDIERRLVKGRR